MCECNNESCEIKKERDEYFQRLIIRKDNDTIKKNTSETMAIVFIYCLWKGIELEQNNIEQIEDIIMQYKHDPVFRKIYHIAKDIFKNVLL